MRRQPFLLTIGLLLGCGGVAVAQCVEPNYPNSVIDNLQQQQVQTGRNAGELEGLTGIVGHPQAQTTWTMSWRRVADANGRLIATGQDTGPLNAQSFTLGSNLLKGPCDTPPAAGCAQHQLQAAVINLQDYGSAGSVNIEQRLASYASDPGVYEFNIGHPGYSGGNGDARQYTKNYNLSPGSYPVQFRFKNAAGHAVPYVTVAINKPWVETWNPGDASGIVTRNLAPQRYYATFTAPGYKTHSNVYFRVRDTPDVPNSNVIDILMLETGSPSSYTTDATMTVLVVDNTNQKPIPNARVYLNGKGYTADNNGEIYATGFVGGQQVEIIVSATGYYGSQSYVNPNSQVGNTYRIALSRNPNNTGGGGDDGDGTTSPGGFNPLDATWWTNLFTSLLVPKEETLKGFQALFNQVKSWGPFGLVNDFLAAWNTSSRAGKHGLCFPISFQPLGSGYQPVSWCLDLRPELPPNVEPYEDGGRGGPFGNTVAKMRQIAGFTVWAAWMFAIIKWVRPRITA